MRYLVILRGIPGIGKSTFIRENHLEDYTLSSDNIRKLYACPVLDAQGEFKVDQRVNKVTWDLLHNLSEYRMRQGEFLVLDACFVKSKEIHAYDELVKKYRYQVVVVEFPNDCERAIEQNRIRDEVHRVPDESIKRMSLLMSNYNCNVDFEVIAPEEFGYWLTEKASKLASSDLNKYEELVFIGDIHGSYHAMLQAIGNEGKLDPSAYYVFMGDYFCRGKDEVKVFNYLNAIKDCENVCLILGNHEDRIYQFFCEYEGKSGEDIGRKPLPMTLLNTLKKFESAGIHRNDLITFCNSCKPIFQAHYMQADLEDVQALEDVHFICTHGGLSRPITNEKVIFLPERSLTGGSGKTEEVAKVIKSFDEKKVHPNAKGRYINVFGHRNTPGYLIIPNESNMVLDLAVDSEVRCVRFTHRGAQSTSYYYEPQEDVKALVEALRMSDNIKKSSFQFDNKPESVVTSFSFTRKVFQDRIWNDLTSKARGLFINETVYKIVCRGWNKFFNLEEMEETKKENLKDSLQFPISLYEKENGYLGLIGYDHYSNNLIITSKSKLDGDFSKKFREILYSLCTEAQIDEMRRIVQTQDVTLLFEVIDPIWDPHIIEYDTQALVLLDVIENKIELTKYSYPSCCKIAEKIGVPVKKCVHTLSSWPKFEKFISLIDADSQGHLRNEPKYYTRFSITEGFVVEDAKGYMFKIKSPYYNSWKKLRGCIAASFRNPDKFTDYLNSKRTNQYQKDVLQFVKEYALENPELRNDWNIIKIRKLYLEYLEK